MTVTEDYDHIDVSEWLPDRIEVAYAHRIGKGDITRNRGSYTASTSLLPIDVLLEKEIITGDQHRTAMFIYLTRLAIAKSLGLDRVFRDYRLVALDEPSPEISPSAMLTIATKGLKLYEMNLIERITALPNGRIRAITANDYGWMNKCIDSVRKSLDNAQNNIDSYFKSVKKSYTERTTTTSKIQKGSL